VHLSISSSNKILLGKLITIIAGITLVILILEIILRLYGIQPNIRDDKKLWAFTKNRLDIVNILQSNKIITLIGSSRIQHAINVKKMSELTNSNTFQLGISGSQSLPMLMHLVNDPSYNGIIIYDLVPFIFFNKKFDITTRQQDWIKYYFEQKFIEQLEYKLLLLFYNNLAIFSSTKQDIISDLLNHTTKEEIKLRMKEVTVNEFRSARANFSLINASEREKTLVNNLRKISTQYSSKRLGLKYKLVSDLVKKQRKKGGDVIFVRLPSNGLVRKFEQEVFPKKKFYQPFLQNINANAIHFEDYPKLKKFICPDGSHLDMSDKDEFTQELSTLILDNI